MIGIDHFPINSYCIMGNTFWLSLSSVELLSKQKNDSKELDQTKSLLINDIDRKWKKNKFEFKHNVFEQWFPTWGAPWCRGHRNVAARQIKCNFCVFSICATVVYFFFFTSGQLCSAAIAAKKVWKLLNNGRLL